MIFMRVFFYFMQKIHHWFSLQELIDLVEYSSPVFRVSSIQESYVFCLNITKMHYENFPVASLCIPQHIRKYTAAIYSFSRIADDIADEGSLEIDVEKQLYYLQMMENHITICFSQQYTGDNPLWIALQDMFCQTKISLTPFLQLLKAFKQDCVFTQPKSMEDVYDYCAHSAHPVGDIILQLHKNKNETTIELSNYICTGLQLANFLQDIYIDKINGRTYIPKDFLNGVSLHTDDIISDEVFNHAFDMMYMKTKELFDKGSQLICHLDSFRLRCEIALIIEGGNAILEITRAHRKVLLSQKISLSVHRILVTACKALIRVLRSYT